MSHPLGRRRCLWTRQCTEPRAKGRKYCASHWAQFPAAVALPKEG